MQQNIEVSTNTLTGPSKLSRYNSIFLHGVQVHVEKTLDDLKPPFVRSMWHSFLNVLLSIHIYFIDVDVGKVPQIPIMTWKTN